MQPVVVDQSALWNTVSTLTQGLVNDAYTAVIGLIVIMFIVAAFEYVIAAFSISESKQKKEVSDEESYSDYKKKRTRFLTNQDRYEKDVKSSYCKK